MTGRRQPRATNKNHHAQQIRLIPSQHTSEHRKSSATAAFHNREAQGITIAQGKIEKIEKTFEDGD